MMPAAVIKDPTRLWEFGSVEELRAALRQYNALLDDGRLVQRYGPMLPTGEPEPTPEEVAEYERCVSRWRSTVDLGMEHMETRYRTWHKIIDLYYRRDLVSRQEGWRILAGMLGIRWSSCPSAVRCTLDRGEEFEDGRLDVPKCREMHSLHCMWDYDVFNGLVTRAIEALFYTIQGRGKRTS